MTIPQLKDLMRAHGIKPLTGKKADLIDRIQKAGISITEDIYSASEKENEYKYDDIRSGLMKRKMSDLVKLLGKISYTGKIPRRKEDLVNYLMQRYETSLQESLQDEIKKVKEAQQKEQYEYELKLKEVKLKHQQHMIELENEKNELQMMATQDINEDFPEAIPIADVYFPHQPDMPLMEPVDQLFDTGYYHGRIIGEKYNPEDVRNVMISDARLNQEYYSENPQISIQMFRYLLPIDLVQNTLRNTNDNEVIFKSNIDADRYEADEVTDYIFTTEDYKVIGWDVTIDVIDNKIAIIYNRINPIHPLVESEISIEPKSKNIIIKRKQKIQKPKINYSDYNTKLFIDNWLNASDVFGNLKVYFPKDYEHILKQLKIQAKNNNKHIYPATILGMLNKDLVNRLKMRYSLEELYEGAEMLAYGYIYSDLVKVNDEDGDGIINDSADIEKYLV
jgi:hypothetical protein